MSDQRGTRLHSARRHLGLSQVALAAALGVSARVVGRWESGGTRQTDDEARRIALFLEITDLAIATFADEVPTFMDAPRLSLGMRTPREALTDADLEQVRSVLVKTLEGDWT